MSPKKSGGLDFNPLLSRTENKVSEKEGASTETTSTHVDKQTREHADMSSSTSKFTFYYSTQQLERLDDIWQETRGQIKGTRQRISKSQFVRLALDRLLDDFEKDSGKVINLLVEHQGR